MKNNRIILILAAAAFVGLLVFRHVNVRRNVGTGKGCNVLLITLDTTRPDRLGCYGYAPALTPALDALAANGVLFEHALATVPLTTPSHTTILTGLHPPEHGLRINGTKTLDPSITTLAKVLHQAGYDTGAFIAAFVLDSKFGLDQGFDTYHDDLTGAYEQANKKSLSLYRPGNRVVDSSLQWLENRSTKPFFCWVHLYDPHEPYYAHEELAGTRFAGAASYDGEIAFMDMQVKRLMHFLKSRRLSERTLVVAVGDHGEGLGDHKEMEHGYMVYNTTMHVPLLFSLPDKVSLGRRVTTLVSLVDVMPTILDFLEIDPPATANGQSLKPALWGRTIAPRPAYGEADMLYTDFGWCPLRSLTTPDWKYIRTTRAELYDRRSDANERNNLADQKPEITAQLEAELAAIEEEMVAYKTKEVALSEEDKRDLAALGYVGGGRDTDDETVDFSSLRDVKDMPDVFSQFHQLWRLGNEGQFDEAKALAQKIVQKTPESASHVFCRLASTFGTQGNEEKAIELFQEALQHAPDEPNTHVSLGSALGRAGKIEEAIVHFTEALKSDPNHAEACSQLAVAFSKQGKLQEAADQYRKLLKANPDSAAAHAELAVMLGKQGDWNQAAEHYRQAITLEPDDAKNHLSLSNALQKLGKTPDAVDACRQALRLDPGNANTRARLAGALWAAGHLDQAEATLREGLATAPNQVVLLRLLGLLLVSKASWADVEKCFTQLLKLEPGQWSDHFSLGVAQARLGKEPEALKTFDNAVRLGKEHGACLKVGLFWIEQDRYDRAIQVFRTGLAETSQDPSLSNSLAWVLATCPRADLRNGAEAVRLAEAINAKARKDNPQALDTLAAAYAEAARFEDAVATAKRALAAARTEKLETLAEKIEQRLALYQNRKPYREPARRKTK